MKVLIVSRGLPQPDNPTFGIFELDQAKALTKQGIDVTFFAVDLRSIRRKRKYGVVKTLHDGIECYTISIPLGNVPPNIFCPVGSVALKYLFNRVFKDSTEYPDIIHAHFHRQGYMAAELSKVTGIPLVITEHSSDMEKEVVDPKLLKYASAGYRRAKEVIAVSKSLAKRLYENTGVKCTVINNILDTALFVPQQKKQESNSFHFISVGRLEEPKKVEDLIAAFANVCKKNTNVQLDIYGAGAKMTLAKELIEKNELQNKVHLRGAVDRSEVALSLRKADCFILLSNSETFGVAYIEALASGIPVIATRCGGPEEFMEEQYGLLIDKWSIEQAEDAMLYMCKNIRDYNGIAISDQIRKRFSPETIAKQLMAVYEEIV